MAESVILDAMRRHRDAGDLIALITSEFPLAEGFDVDLVLPVDVRPRPDGVGGVAQYAPSSRVTAQLVVETCARLGLDLARCFGYGVLCQNGDEFLPVLGNPRAVVCRPDLAEQARSRGWPVIPVAAEWL